MYGYNSTFLFIEQLYKINITLATDYQHGYDYMIFVIRLQVRVFRLSAAGIQYNSSPCCLIFLNIHIFYYTLLCMTKTPTLKSVK